ncbi:cbb3-type cytochrome c oxidase N-terminal domain-containing protein [Myroides odoratus]|uniref:cbb3-type cytochrome c oxidase N-terminal domain-containing protein n=1 Tax=Myroides odoratus TaxID=256 RepID=UPI0039AF0183
MKKYFPVYVRVPLLFLLFYVLVEWVAGGTAQRPAFVDHPTVLILLGLFLFALIAVEIVASATNKILNRLMTPEELAEQERVENLSFADRPWVQKLMKKMTRSKAISDEKELLLDHDYDGIRELDNELPPWWVGLFYITVIFSVVYLLRFHVFGGDNQIVEYEKAMAIAKEQIEEYKKTAPDLMTAEEAQYLTDESSLAIGKQIFDTNCVACHQADGGGGIGPNLTDDHWILGGGMKNIFHTIAEGGRPGKGMVDWKKTLKPAEIEKVASYIISLNGTTPASPKDAEGDIIWSKAELETTQEGETSGDVKDEAVEASEAATTADTAETSQE